jgi:hypothetical protein
MKTPRWLRWRAEKKRSVTKSDNLMWQQTEEENVLSAGAPEGALAVELARLGWRCPSGHACRIIFWLVLATRANFAAPKT